jgi:hypothetical protein
MGTHKKAGRKAHVGRPTNEEIARRKAEEMKGTNPQAKTEEVKPKEGTKEGDDAGKSIMSNVRSSIGVGMAAIGKFFAGIPAFIGGFFKGVGEAIGNLWTTITEFIKGFGDKSKVNTGAGRAKTIFNLILLASVAVLGVQVLLSYLTLSQIAIGAGVGTAASYGLQRWSMPKDLKEASSASIKEMLLPVAVKAA